MIASLLLMNYKYAPPDNQKWGNKTALIVPQMKWNYTLPESESGRNMSTMIALLMEWKYTLPDNLKR